MIRIEQIALLLLLVLVLAPGLRAQEEEGLADEIRDLVTTIVSAPDPGERIEELWLTTRARHGRVGLLIDHLREISFENTAIKRVLAAIQRRDGRLEDALATIEEIGEEQRSVADRLFIAEAMDALGRTDDARNAYESLLDDEISTELEKTIRLRVALMQKESVTALSDFVNKEVLTIAQRNEAAIALALLGDRKTAVQTFTVEGESTERFRREVRMAEWAIACEDFARAQDLAWAAHASAKMRRDRRYALTLLASAYRRAGAVSELLDRFANLDEMSGDLRQLWIRLLREEGRVDEALRLFRENESAGFTAPMRRQLLEICRETGREEVLIEAFEKLIREEPGNLEWRSGLSRHYLENGERERAVAVWSDFSSDTEPRRLLDAAFTLQDVGLDDVAERLARMAARSEALGQSALLFVFKLHLARGNFEEAEATLAELSEIAPEDGGLRAEIADGYERIKRPDLAVKELETLRAARAGFLGTDLEMKYAILLSKLDREEEALAIWRTLWVRLRSSPRARFVEDRMMTVAARLGVLARIAIDLEDRLAKGRAGDEDIDLLVRLYIKVGDPASATEILEEYMKSQGEDDLELIRRKSKIYLACQDYYNYERLVHELIERDEEGRLDHLRELVMSQLERGRRDLAIALLPRIREASEDEEIADEFEAGIYGLVGMKEKSLLAYLKGMGRHPERIDTYLLISNLMRETGEEMRAVRMFQYMAQTAKRDDLFTIAIDGILNLRAPRQSTVPDEPVRWALRTSMERLAERPHRFYLYRLTADLAEELEDLPLAIRTLKAGLPVAGERRTAIMREIMNKCLALDPKARRSFGSVAFEPSDAWDATEYVMIGRRLLGQGDHVPPSIFMSLAKIFIRQDDVPAAMRTFSRAAELLDHAEVMREAAFVLESSGKLEAALSFYRRVLATSADDPALITKVGNIEEEIGREDDAFAMYRRALELIIERKPRFVTQMNEKEVDRDDPFAYYGRGNVDQDDKTLAGLMRGIMTTLADEQQAAGLVRSLSEGLDRDLAAVEGEPEKREIAEHPRLATRLRIAREIALVHGLLETSAALDERIMRAFPDDRSLVRRAVLARKEQGYLKPAGLLLSRSPFSSDDELRAQVGGLEIGAGADLTFASAASRLIPMLGKSPGELRALLERIDTSSLGEADVEAIPAIVSACVIVDDPETGERTLRAGLRASNRKKGDREAFETMIALANRLDPAIARRLFREQIDERAKSPGFFYQLKTMEDCLGGELVDEATARRLLKASAEGAARDYGLGVVELLGRITRDQRPILVRELHRDYPESKRSLLLLRAVSYLEGPLEEGFEDWLARSLVRDMKNSDGRAINLGFNFGDEEGFEPSPSLMLKVAEAVEEQAPSIMNDGVRIMALMKLDRRDEALALFEEHLPRFFASDYRANTARRKLMEACAADEDRRALLAVVTRLGKEDPEHEGLARMRTDLLARGDDFESYVRGELEKRPDDKDLLARLSGIQAGQGHLPEAIDTLRRLVELDPKNPRWPRQIKRYLTRLEHPLAAEKVEIPGQKEDQTAAASLITIGGAVVVSRATASTTVAGGGGPSAAQPKGALGELQQLIEEGKLEEARRKLRSMWRTFRGDDRRFGSRFPMNLLLMYGDYGVRRVPTGAATVFGAITDPPAFVAEEARLVLKSISGSSNAFARQVRSELLDVIAAVIPDEDRQATIDSLRERAARGEASGDELGLLLRLFGESEEELTPDLLEIVERPEVPDGPRLRLLGSLLARAGQIDRAGALLRLQALSDRERTFGVRKTLKQRILDYEKILGEEGKDRLVELTDDLAFGTTGYQAGAAARDAVMIWNRLLPPSEAAQRTRRVLHLAKGRYANLFTRSEKPGDVPAAIARIGMTAEALAICEQLLVVDEGAPRGSGSSAYHEKVVEGLTDAEGSWADREAWLVTLADRFLERHASDRLRSPCSTLGTLAIVLVDAGKMELARRCTEAAEAAAESGRDLGHVALALRKIGEVEKADSIERDLLAKRRLAVDRIAEVVKRIAETDPNAALEAAETAGAYTNNKALVDFLAERQKAAGNTERAEHWQAVKAELEKREAEAKAAAEKAKRN